MNNNDLSDAFEELFHLQALVGSELDYYISEDGNAVVTSGWGELRQLLDQMDDLSPYLDLIQATLTEELDL